MADWRQIQARIRKAKNSPDAPTKLNELFQRTRDGMVAWELGVIEEKAERREEAGRWYTIAAQRFRRADWRKKAEEALTRLGMEIPAPAAAAEPSTHAAAAEDTAADPHNREIEESGEEADEVDGNRMPLALGEIPESNEEEEDDEEVEAQPSGAPAAAGEGGPAGKRKRRRGRRGGRGRRRKGAAPVSGLPSQAFAQSGEPQQQARPAVPHLAPPAHERPAAPERVAAAEPAAAVYERPARGEAVAPQLPSERSAHGRGDPALASRMAHLESLLRRLVQSPLHRLDECDDAPAGPGVFLLSDSDQITSYYVEACQTLRIGAGNLARGGRSAKPQGRGGRGGYSSESGLKGRLAEHLGINESKVSQYMKDHCVLRWIQLDDEAPMLAHFAIGVLRTPLNLD
jgi:hypothetical protein